MKAVILCAGNGTRLKPITYFKPKCMVKVAGKPVLERLIDHLYSFGINDIVVNVRHKHNQIIKHFGTRLLYFYEPSLLGEQGTLNVLRPWLKDDYTILMNGDTLTNLDILDLVDRSHGQNVVAMDGNTPMGTKIIAPGRFWADMRREVQVDDSVYWFDIGTHSGLAKARKFYEQKSN